VHNPPANGKQGLIPEEMSQTLLTNKKQGNMAKVHATYIIKRTVSQDFWLIIVFLNQFPPSPRVSQ
jgi:hypothetical protein